MARSWLASAEGHGSSGHAEAVDQETCSLLGCAGEFGPGRADQFPQQADLEVGGISQVLESPEAAGEGTIGCDSGRIGPGR
jgi:hypothetical protein